MGNLSGKYIESFFPERTASNKLIKRMTDLGFFSRFEAEAILKKYHIGTATDGEPAFWIFNEFMEIKSVKVKNSVFFGMDGMWNIPTVVSNEPFERVGICSTIEEAFWCNMYMKQTAIWITVPQSFSHDLKLIYGLDVVAILKTGDPLEDQIKHAIPYATIFHNDNLIDSLLKTGAPLPYVLPPNTKPFEMQNNLTEFRDKFTSNAQLLDFIDSLDLKFT